MQDPDDPKTNGQSQEDSSNDNNSQPSGHQIPEASQVDETLLDEPQFEDPVASPSVTGEEDASGDAPSGEPVDIDEQLQKVGISADSGEES